MKRYAYTAKHSDGTVIVTENHTEATRASFTGWLTREGFQYEESATDSGEPSTELSEEAKAERAAVRALVKAEKAGEET